MRRVGHVVVHNALNVSENVLVVVHICSVAFCHIYIYIFVREFLVQDVLYLHTPVGDSRLPSAVTDYIHDKNFEFNSC